MTITPTIDRTITNGDGMACLKVHVGPFEVSWVARTGSVAVYTLTDGRHIPLNNAPVSQLDGSPVDWDDEGNRTADRPVYFGFIWSHPEWFTFLAWLAARADLYVD